MPKNLYLTTKRVSELLRVDVRTVHRLADRGDLPHALKIPGRTGAYLFDPAAVEAYRQQREQSAA